MFIEDIKTASPFRDLFPSSEELLERIVWSMRKNGYDQSQPLILWDCSQPVIIDGHIRFRAARKAGLYQIPVIMKKFSEEAEAVQYAIGCQRNRRNLRDAELFNCIAVLDQKKIQGTRCEPGRSSADTGALLGISHRKVERTRTVISRAPEEMIAAIQSGEISINQAYERTIKPAISPPPDKVADVFNAATQRLNKEEISELIARLQVYLEAS